MVILLFNYWTNDPAQIIQSPFVFDHRFFSLWTFNISLRASKKKWWATILNILSELPRSFKLSMWVQMTLVWKSHSYFLTQNREQDWLSLAVMKLRVWSDSHHSEICKGLILSASPVDFHFQMIFQRPIIFTIWQIQWFFASKSKNTVKNHFLMKRKGVNMSSKYLTALMSFLSYFSIDSVF